jgi:hypothetical protein
MILLLAIVDEERNKPTTTSSSPGSATSRAPMSWPGGTLVPGENKTLIASRTLVFADLRKE